MNTNNIKKQKLLIGLVITLLVCLWIGWSDFDPNMPQEVIRENIRASIRGVIQISVQYLVPIAIISFFITEAMVGNRSKLRKS